MGGRCHIYIYDEKNKLTDSFHRVLNRIPHFFVSLNSPCSLVHILHTSICHNHAGVSPTFWKGGGETQISLASLLLTFYRPISRGQTLNLEKIRGEIVLLLHIIYTRVSHQKYLFVLSSSKASWWAFCPEIPVHCTLYICTSFTYMHIRQMHTYTLSLPYNSKNLTHSLTHSLTYDRK